jgi:hypothetical protein
LASSIAAIFAGAMCRSTSRSSPWIPCGADLEPLSVHTLAGAFTCPQTHQIVMKSSIFNSHCGVSFPRCYCRRTPYESVGGRTREPRPSPAGALSCLRTIPLGRRSAAHKKTTPPSNRAPVASRSPGLFSAQPGTDNLLSRCQCPPLLPRQRSAPNPAAPRDLGPG